MFDRFDYDARLTLDRAGGEAARFNHGTIHTEHVLLALLFDARIADLVSRLGVTPADVRIAIEQRMQWGHGLFLDATVPQAAEVRDALESAVEEADGFGHARVGNAHLLLGLLKEPDGLAGRLLESTGAMLDGTRHEVLEFIAEYDREEVGAA